MRISHIYACTSQRCTSKIIYIFYIFVFGVWVVDCFIAVQYIIFFAYVAFSCYVFCPSVHYITFCIYSVICILFYSVFFTCSCYFLSVCPLHYILFWSVYCKSFYPQKWTKFIDCTPKYENKRFTFFVFTCCVTFSVHPYIIKYQIIIFMPRMVEICI